MSSERRGRNPAPENEAIRACWEHARNEMMNKATGHAPTEEVSQRTIEVFQERYLDPVVWDAYGTHYSAILNTAKISALQRRVNSIRKQDLQTNRDSLCEALATVKDLAVASMPRRLAREVIDKALRPVYDLVIKVPSPDYSKHWEKKVGTCSFEEMARAAQYRSSLLTERDKPSLEKFEFVAKAGYILGAEAKDTLRNFFAKAA